MLANELFYITLLHSLIGYYFEYLSLSPFQVCGVSLTRFKYFKVFWSCSFTSPSVKGANNFWKSRGVVDGFNELRRKISSGKVKSTDESMSSIRFCTTPKGNLPHYYYIFRNMKSLGTEINNVACSRLGAMLYL